MPVKKSIAIAAILGALAVSGLADGSRERPADLVLHNANVITVDEALPRARAVAVRDGEIFFVGGDEGALKFQGQATKVIDLEGKTLIPGFNDNHVHSLAGGAFYLEPILHGLSCEEIADVVREEAAKRDKGEVVTGNSWDYPTCPEPHKSILDEAAPDNPVYLIQYSGHAAWANSAMLEKMGIGRDTPDPKGGQIVRGPGGEPTGVLRDTAMGNSTYTQFARLLMKPERHRDAIDKALELYRRAGVTSVQDNTWEPLTARLLAKYRDSGKLTCRFTCWPYGQARGAHYLMNVAGFDDKWVRKGPWKFFADGAFSTRTAWMTEPYADEPGNLGEPRYTPGELDKIVMKAARERRQIVIHAIGDRAIREVLDSVEKAEDRHPEARDLRIRIEHVQLVLPGDFERMKRLGVLACVQPFALSQPEKDRALLGDERGRRAFPYHALMDAGVPVSFGSDLPAEVDYQPLLGMYYAMTRMNKAGDEGPLNPDERFTAEEALYCYTMGGAYAEFMEDRKGSVTPGKLADFAVLSEDPLAAAPERIKDIDVLMTIVGGKIVFDQGAARGGK